MKSKANHVKWIKRTWCYLEPYGLVSSVNSTCTMHMKLIRREKRSTSLEKDDIKVSNWKQQIERNVRDRGSIHYPVFQWGMIRFDSVLGFKRERDKTRRILPTAPPIEPPMAQPAAMRARQLSLAISSSSSLFLSNFCSHSTCILWRRTSSFSSSVFTACYGVGQACTTGSDLINPFHDIRIHYPIRSYRIRLRMHE